MPIELLPILQEEQAEKTDHTPTPPESVVVRFGYLREIGELPYQPKEVPRCGMKLVARTPRGTEVVEMLTTACSSNACGYSVDRKQMLEYIETSGGKQYPFTEDGKVLRVASPEDLKEQARLDSRKPQISRTAREIIRQIDLPMKLIEVEPLLGEERLIFYFMSEQRVDFRELVRQLAGEFQTRIEMRQVGARDEARLAADYEKCGQHCCCRQFLKVLRPVSMKSAKIQKATLDPAKISGRCGRLMCCLRYEQQSYDELRKQLPNRNARMLTADGPGRVIHTQILTQLAVIELDRAGDRKAYPVEEIEPYSKERAEELEQQAAEAKEKERREAALAREAERKQSTAPEPTGYRGKDDMPDQQKNSGGRDKSSGSGKKRGRRRGGRRRDNSSSGGDGGGDAQSDQSQASNESDKSGGSGKKRRGRRRRRRRGRGGGGNKGGGQNGA